MGRIEMQDDDERGAAIAGRGGEEAADGVEAAGRGANADDRDESAWPSAIVKGAEDSSDREVRPGAAVPAGEDA